ncbi:MAG: A/G-specific adenine glycosylase, partial [Gammaproteobacteria bacterium]|nr:A/G-specific adenine glycosylase [Gammaproteobacteria bacterium]
AHAPIDDVLAHWSGLGYYARARNLHAAAVRCLEEHGGDLPPDAEALESLPGIGRSTANAIVAQAHDRCAPILDGNVKRVLARHAGVEGWPGRSAVLRALWKEAEALAPRDRARDYTQAIMDLGATLCTPRRPACERCPVAEDCVARGSGRVEELPASKPKRSRPRRDTTLVIIENDRGELLLQRRPPSGIWGGLWSLPESGDIASLPRSTALGAPESIRHQFTHFVLDIRFERYRIPDESAVSDREDRRWLSPDAALGSGLPQPVRRLLERLFESRH